MSEGVGGGGASAAGEMRRRAATAGETCRRAATAGEACRRAATASCPRTLTENNDGLRADSERVNGARAAEGKDLWR